MAARGDELFVTEDSYLSAYRLSDGQRIFRCKGGRESRSEGSKGLVLPAFCQLSGSFSMISLHFSASRSFRGETWELQKPHGLCVIEDRLLAIADRTADRVLVLDLESRELLREVPDASVRQAAVEARRERRAPPAAALRGPNDVAVDAAGNLLVLDTMNERVAVYQQESRPEII